MYSLMAAKGQPGKSTKMVWHTCLKCTTRLSELCYDTHTLCEVCRDKVCDFNSFCEECESWTQEFRKLYMRHKRTLYLKRVSKRDAKSSPGVDDDASTASRESRVSPPMVILPLDPHLVDTEMNLAELGNIQTVDSVVEVQYQPVSMPPPPPPHASAAFDASLMNSAFAKLNEMLDEFRGRRPPLREHVGSDRRSPSAGPSDIARPNPIAKVSDTAPQGPDVAPQSPDAVPRPSTATHVPPALGPSRREAPSDDGFVSPHGGVDRGEHVRYGSCHMSPSRTHTHHEQLREDLERTHAKISQLRDYNDYCRARGRAPPDHYYRDLDILHSRYDQLSLALAESHQAIASGRSGRSPVIASPSDAPLPHRPDSSSFKGPRLSPWPGPSPDRRRPRGVSSDRSHHQKSAIVTDSLLALSLGTVSVPGQGVPLLQSEWDSPQGVSPLQSEWHSPPRGPLLQRGPPPLQSEWDSLQGRPLHQSEWDSLQGTPPLPNDNVLLRGILLHLDVNTHPVLRLVRIHLRDPHCGLLLPIRLHLPEKIRKLKNRLCQPRLGP